MGEPRRAGDLEVAEDLTFQRRAWRAQRVGWVLLALVVAGAAAGLFGNGPLTAAEVASGGGTLAFHRVARANSAIAWRIRAPAGTQGTLRVAIDHPLLRDLDPAGVVPPPLRVEPRAEAVVHHFAPGAPVDVTLHFRPRTPGRVSGAVTINDGPPARVSILVLP